MKKLGWRPAYAHGERACLEAWLLGASVRHTTVDQTDTRNAEELLRVDRLRLLPLTARWRVVGAASCSGTWKSSC